MKCQYIRRLEKLEKQYRAKLTWWKWLLGYCPCCGRYFRWPVTVARRLTQYCVEANNYMTACIECHEEDDAYYEELWKEYNAGRL